MLEKTYDTLYALSIMTNSLAEFYNALYDKSPNVFGDSSRAFLEHAVTAANPPKGRALDIGAGEGRASIWLAENGYEVDAVDISDIALKNIQNNRIHPHVTSIGQFPLKQEYDLINIALVMHHLDAESIPELIGNLQAHTNHSGIHVIRLFTQNSAFFKNSKGVGYFDDGVNFNALYKGWNVILDETYMSKAATQDVTNELRQVVFQKM